MMPNPNTRQRSVQIEVLHVLNRKNEVDLEEELKVIEQSFLEKPVHRIILDFSDVQELSQGSQKFLRKLVRQFLQMDLQIILAETVSLGPADLIEISQGVPVLESMEAAREFYALEGTGEELERLQTIEVPAVEKEEALKEELEFLNEEELNETVIYDIETQDVGISTPVETRAYLQNVNPPGLLVVGDLSGADLSSGGLLFEEHSPDDASEEKLKDSKVDEVLTEDPAAGTFPYSTGRRKRMLILFGLIAVLCAGLTLLGMDGELWESLKKQITHGLPTWIAEEPVFSEPEAAPPQSLNEFRSGISPDETIPDHGGLEIEARDSRGYTPLMKAVINGDLEMLVKLLEQGAETEVADHQGDTPLVWAASQNQPELLRLLLNHGANPNRGNFNALMWASFHGNGEVVRLLLEQGGDPDLRSRDGRTALMWAVEQGHLPAVRRLLEARALVDLQNGEGYTALMFAVRKGRVDVVRFLMESGADPSIKSFDRRTALDLAREHDRQELLPLLKH